MTRVLALLTAILLSGGIARAASSDMITGVFKGTWCGYRATFNVDWKEDGKWIFHGTLYFPDYHQTDELWIEQYDDDSLRMSRTLPGGRKQSAQVPPPVDHPGADGGFWQFSTKQTGGPDCNKKRTAFSIPD